MIKTMTFCLGLLMALGACNTMEGAGKDIQAGGANLQGAAHDTHQSMERDERYPDRY